MSEFKKVFILPVALFKVICTGISAVTGFITGPISGWIYYLFLIVINKGKKRMPLSASLRDKLYRLYPSFDLAEVRIIGNARGIPYGKTAVTHGNYIFCKNDFSEDNMEDYNLLLHELVHVEQYRKYGKAVFYILYGFQYLNSGFSYRRIELEREAFDCHRRQTDAGRSPGGKDHDAGYRVNSTV